MAKMQSWKGEVVTKLTGGVRTLLKANGCDYRTGHGEAHRPQHRRGDRTRTGRSPPSRPTTSSSPPARGPSRSRASSSTASAIIDSTGALDFASVPERLLVIGGGFIGLEIGTLYAKLGSKVTVVEALPAILPGNDPGVVAARRAQAQEARRQGHDGRQGQVVDREGRARRRHVERRRQGRDARGRQGPRGAWAGARTARASASRRSASRSSGGFVTVDKQRRTNVPGIYAIGDVTGQPMLAHKATRRPRSSPRSSPATRRRWTCAASRP